MQNFTHESDDVIILLDLSLNNPSSFSFLFKADFDAKLESAGDLLVVVDFHATWCGPCKMIAPKLEEFSAKYTDKVVIVKV